MVYNYTRAAKTADRLIKKYGAACKLRRTEGDRDCIAAEAECSPEERKLLQPNDKLYLISAKGLTIPPNKDKDTLVTYLEDGTEEKFKFIKNPSPLKPARIVVYWECWVKGAFANG